MPTAATAFQLMAALPELHPQISWHLPNGFGLLTLVALCSHQTEKQGKIRVHPQILILSCIAASFSSSISIYFPLPATIFGRSSEAPRVFSLQALQDYLGSRCLVGWSRISGVFSTEKNWLLIQGLKIMNILSLSISISLSLSLSLHRLLEEFSVQLVASEKNNHWNWN